MERLDEVMFCQARMQNSLPLFKTEINGQCITLPFFSYFGLLSSNANNIVMSLQYAVLMA